MPNVSVLMSVWNAERYVARAIESILGQTYKNIEFLICDDGSTDESLKIVRSYKDARIKIFQNRRRRGIAYCLNTLLSKAKGQYIARMDADDISLPRRLAVQVKCLDQYKDIMVVGSFVYEINAQGEKIGTRRFPVLHKDICRAVFGMRPFYSHPALMIRREVFCQIGGYDKALDGAEDYDFILRLLPTYKMMNIESYLLQYRIHTDMVSIRDMKRLAQKTIQARVKAVRQYGYSPLLLLLAFRTICLLFTPNIILHRFIGRQGRLRP